MQTPLELVQQHHRKHSTAVLNELIEFVKIPNNVFQVDQIEANARYLRGILESRGVHVELWPTPHGRPLVFGNLPSQGASTTILIYGHYDGVPVEREYWHSDPYNPVFRAASPQTGRWDTLDLAVDDELDESWRVFGRSIADSKNAIVAMLAALDALRSQNIAPNVNLKFLFDGAEEIESPGLATCLMEHRDRLDADFVISASGETHQSGLPTVELGVRGILQFDVAVYTSTDDLHSGHFGNFAPNAVAALANLISSMKSKDGRVLVNGYYDDIVPLSSRELAAIERIPRVEADVQQKFGILNAETPGQSLQELINLPTLNVRGMTGGYTGEQARNIIPGCAVAEFDVRLVKGMDPDTTLQRIIAHIGGEGWMVTDHEPTREELLERGRIARVVKKAGFPATRTEFDSAASKMVVDAVTHAVEVEVVVMPTEGGSLPLYLFEQIGIPMIGLPTSNFDCNQHTHDENLQLKYFFRAIDIFASMFLGSAIHHTGTAGTDSQHTWEVS